MYAIYGADEDGQEELALFDEEGGDDDLVDLGEAVEMFWQMLAISATV